MGIPHLGNLKAGNKREATTTALVVEPMQTGFTTLPTVSTAQQFHEMTVKK